MNTPAAPLFLCPVATCAIVLSFHDQAAVPLCLSSLSLGGRIRTQTCKLSPPPPLDPDFDCPPMLVLPMLPPVLLVVWAVGFSGVFETRREFTLVECFCALAAAAFLAARAAATEVDGRAEVGGGIPGMMVGGPYIFEDYLHRRTKGLICEQGRDDDLRRKIANDRLR